MPLRSNQGRDLRRVVRRRELLDLDRLLPLLRVRELLDLDRLLPLRLLLLERLLPLRLLLEDVRVDLRVAIAQMFSNPYLLYHDHAPWATTKHKIWTLFWAAI